jgi:hypothetical protein
MEEEQKVEPLRDSLQAEKEETKWKKVTIIFCVVAICSTILLVTFMVLYFTKDNDNNSEGSNSSDSDDGSSPEPDVNPEDKWDWKPAGDRLKTRWGINLDPKKVWQEYPRPQLERKDWINLNGPWKYSIRNQGDIDPDEHDGYILVPFPLESSLSGVMKSLTADQVIYYEKTVTLPEEWDGKHVLLNFGAVDWKCEVFINKKRVGDHTGGYSYFYFDITNYLKGRKNVITLRVTDITDSVDSSWGKYQPVGKQTLTPNGIWYTPASGIWQTVWLEPVTAHYIDKIDINNNYDNKEIKLTFNVANSLKLPIEYCIKYNDQIIANGKGKSNQEITINVSQNFHPWSPTEPNLYMIMADLKSDAKDLLDSITSYTTIRKLESRKDSAGIPRIFLNDKPLFNIGPLDQGYWPDGIYTPPSEEAMVFDIQRMKDLGFNTLRKHAKTETFRFYYQCDKIGMVVWQDMPSGNVGTSGSWDPWNMDGGEDTVRTQGSKDNYYKEWEGIIQNLKFFQCIIVWTPFNEAWGQFDTEAVVQYTLQRDNLRLINAASGGNHRAVGNFIDFHTYPDPRYPFKYNESINVVGEYGGLGLEIKNHTWKDDNWSYNQVYSKEELTGNYTVYIETLIDLAKQGISAAIYTQVTDVEGEINGLMTYDRNETKIFDSIKEVNERLIASLSE